MVDTDDITKKDFLNESIELSLTDQNNDSWQNSELLHW